MENVEQKMMDKCGGMRGDVGKLREELHGLETHFKSLKRVVDDEEYERERRKERIRKGEEKLGAMSEVFRSRRGLEIDQRAAIKEAIREEIVSLRGQVGVVRKEGEAEIEDLKRSLRVELSEIQGRVRKMLDNKLGVKTQLTLKLRELSEERIRFEKQVEDLRREDEI